MATSASVYNYERTTRQILKRHRKDPASFSVHIHAQFLRFEKQVRDIASFRANLQDGYFLFKSRTKVRTDTIDHAGIPSLLMQPDHSCGFDGCVPTGGCALL